MTTIKSIALKLEDSHKLQALYRFQGNPSVKSSRRHLDFQEKIGTAIFNTEGYVYFSRHISHHKYFIHKRLRQDVNVVLELNNQPKICRQTLFEQQSYDNIRKYININFDTLQCESIRLLITPKLGTLLKSNYVLQKDKKNTFTPIPELSDIRKLGGAYGISNEWLMLLTNLSMFYGKTIISYDDIINYIYKLKLNFYCATKSDTTEFIDKKSPTIAVNEKIYSPYHKYSIIDNLENIYEKKAYVIGSDFSKNPSKNIREIIDEYSELRDYILSTLEKVEKQKILNLENKVK